jgi:hypothetical protein
MNSRDNQRTKVLVSGVMAAAGIAVVAVLFLVQELPRPLWLWGALIAVFFVLELSSVEVNDRLLISSGNMVGFAAAVIFGPESAVLAAAVMASFAAVHPSDLRQRRWQQPLVNFGQIVISTAIGMAVLTPFLPAGTVSPADLGPIAIGGALAATVHAFVNFKLVSLLVQLLYPDRPPLPWSKVALSQAGLISLGALGTLLGAAYVVVGAVVLPLMIVVFAVGHVGFSSYSQLRGAHESTVAGLVKALEAIDPYSKGHTERVAHFARITGEALGFHAERLETLRWAALIHDVGKLAVPSELLQARGELDEEGHQRMVRHMRAVEAVLGQVDFLRPMVAIVDQVHDAATGGAGVEARILAAADAFDALTSARSYRSAVTQTAAFAALRRRSEAFSAEVVEALIGAIAARGETYGSPEEGTSEEVARLVKERAIRA